jgi:transposase-like protein
MNRPKTTITVSDRLAESADIPIKCPRCNRSTQYKAGRVRHNPNLRCPTCWVDFEVTISQPSKAPALGTG